MSVLAIALNPTIDVSSAARRIHPTVKIRTQQERQRAGGGGVNVASIIAVLGGRPELVILSGGATGAMLKDALAALSIDVQSVPIVGATRIAFMVREEETGLEYRFVPEGPEISHSELAAALRAIEMFRGDYVVASGSLPRNVPANTYARIGKIAAKVGARFILDCPAMILRETLGNAPIFLVKPSIEELEALTGARLDEDGVARAASALVKDGAAEFVAVTMGREGALLAGTFGTLRVPSKHVVTKTAVGAGDSFIGGFIWLLTNGGSIEQAFRFGVAAGAAAVMAPRGDFCRREDIIANYGDGWLPHGN